PSAAANAFRRIDATELRGLTRVRPRFVTSDARLCGGLSRAEDLSPSRRYVRRMPRLPRNLEPGLYHLTACGVRSERIFLTGEDGSSYLELAGEVTDPEDFLCRGFALMPTHTHLLVETRTGRISDAMRRLQGVYALRFNKRHDVAGHVFRGRFGSEHITTDAYLMEVIRYIALNPVRAGLCGTAVAWR